MQGLKLHHRKLLRIKPVLNCLRSMKRDRGGGGWGPGRNWDGRGAGGEKERLESGIAKVAGTGRKCEKKNL